METLGLNWAPAYVQLNRWLLLNRSTYPSRKCPLSCGHNAPWCSHRRPMHPAWFPRRWRQDKGSNTVHRKDTQWRRMWYWMLWRVVTGSTPTCRGLLRYRGSRWSIFSLLCWPSWRFPGRAPFFRPAWRDTYSVEVEKGPLKIIISRDHFSQLVIGLWGWEDELVALAATSCPC